MTTPASKVLILFSLPTDVKGRKRDEQVAEILTDVNRVHAAIGDDCQREAVEELRFVAEIMADGNFDVIFNLVEELPNGPEEVNAVPMLCRAFGKRCTGNTVVVRDKATTNFVLAAHGILVPKMVLIPQDYLAAELPDTKFILKPTTSDGSEGITDENIIEAESQHANAKAVAVIKKIHANGQDATAEQFIEGREVTAAVIERDGKPFVLPLSEIEFHDKAKAEIADYKAKWAEGSKEYESTPVVCPAKLPKPLENEIVRIAKTVWKALDLHGYARVDFRVSKQGTPYVLEANPNSDLGVDGQLVEPLKVAGISFPQFIHEVIENAK